MMHVSYHNLTCPGDISLKVLSSGVFVFFLSASSFLPLDLLVGSPCYSWFYVPIPPSNSEWRWHTTLRKGRKHILQIQMLSLSNCLPLLPETILRAIFLRGNIPNSTKNGIRVVFSTSMEMTVELCLLCVLTCRVALLGVWQRRVSNSRMIHTLSKSWDQERQWGIFCYDDQQSFCHLPMTPPGTDIFSFHK